MTDADVPADLPAGVPRRNGELAFDAPWESRAFGLAAAYVRARGCGWDRFRAHLIAAIAGLPDDTPYWEAWVVAFERLLADDGVVVGVVDAASVAPPPAREDLVGHVRPTMPAS